MNRTLLPFLFFGLLLCAACDNQEKVLAQVYYHKLYESEVAQMMPTGLNPTDSLAMVQDYIENWIKEQLILHEAEKTLTLHEKNFDKQIDNYRKNLLINAYYEKLIRDTNTFKITESDLHEFMKAFDKRYTVEKEIVKVNYVKLSKTSNLIAPVKAILFDAEKRVSEKKMLTQLLGDSIEYLIDDDAWLYLDDIQNEISFEITADDLNDRANIEKEIGNHLYLLVILDYKNQRSVSETTEEKAAAKMMLLNQRKQEFLKQNNEKLYKKALDEGVVVK